MLGVYWGFISTETGPNWRNAKKHKNPGSLTAQHFAGIHGNWRNKTIIIRNQQVMCSSHTTSSKKHRKLRFSMLFCCENAEKGVGQNVGQALTHTVTHKRNKLYPRKWTRDFDPWSRSADTHLTHRGSQRLCRLLPAHAPWVQRNARKEPKSTGEKLLPFRCSACLRDLSNLRHEAAHFLRGLLLHLPCDVGVGSQGESRVVVTEH